MSGELRPTDFKRSEQLRRMRELAESNGNVLDPRHVVEDARDPKSVFHDEFTWDVREAAERCWLAEAEMLIRRVKFTIVRVASDPTTIPVKITRAAAFPSLASQRERGGASRQPLDIVMADEDKRADLLATALGELRALQAKYSNLVELSDIWDAISKHPPGGKKGG